MPAHNSPSRLFAEMFLEGQDNEVRAQVRRLEDGRSILDDVRDQARSLRSNLGADDRDKLDEYLTSVRELEQRLVTDEKWAKTPKPKVNVEPPKDIPNRTDLIGRTRLLFDLAHLAVQTDSTRLITIMLAGSTSAPPIPGVTLGHHDLSHHGKDPGKLAQLKIVEVECMKILRDLLAKLKQSQEGGETLLDRTTVFLGSNLGDASSHSVKNLPVLLAGGGFRHGQHLAFDPQNPPPLCNLYVSMLQRLGIEVDKFSTGTRYAQRPGVQAKLKSPDFNSATHPRTTTTTSPFSSPVADFSTRGTSPSTRRTTHCSPISMSACCTTWALRRSRLEPAWESQRNVELMNREAEAGNDPSARMSTRSGGTSGE